MISETEIWKWIVYTYLQAKKYNIIDEELSREKEASLPACIEWRDAHDHIMRAFACEMGQKPPPEGTSKEQYTDNTLETVFNHEYQAFFDVADKFSIIVQNDTSSIIDKFPHDVVIEVIKNYVPNYKFLKKNSRDIAALRENKDGDKSLEAKIEDVKKYSEILEKFDKFLVEVEESFEVLVSVQSKKGKDESRKKTKEIVTLVIVGILIALITVVLTLCFVPQSSP